MGGGEECVLTSFRNRVKIVGLYIKFETCSRSQKKSFKITILTEIRFISLKTPIYALSALQHKITVLDCFQ